MFKKYDVPKKYKSYRTKNDGSYCFPVESEQFNKDRYYMCRELKPHINFLEQNGIKNHENFLRLLHNFRFKANDIRKLIKGMTKHLNAANADKNIVFMKKRQLKKTNSEEKNIILNRIACEYPDDLVNFVENEFLESMENFEKKRKNIFVDELKKLVDSVSSQRKDMFQIQDFDVCGFKEESDSFYENDYETNNEIYTGYYLYS